MGKYETAMMEITEPVINYLVKNFPKDHFTTQVSYNTRNNDISTTVTVKEELAGKESQDICSITNSAIHGLNYSSFNPRMLNYQTLVRLAESTGIDVMTLFSLKISESIHDHKHTINNHF
jgi:hypothetical protein